MARPQLTESALGVALPLALPPLIVTLCSATLLAAAAAGVHPFWSERPITMIDAVVAGDHGRVLQMIRQGHDPNRGTADGTPLDHAVRRNDVRLVRLLLKHGVVLDDGARREAACAALRQGSAEIFGVVRGARALTCGEGR
jgi:hypothetical protein